MSNAIEILLHGETEGVDESFHKVREGFESIKHAAEAFLVAFAIEKFIEGMAEGEEATHKLDQAYKNLGANSKVTRERLTELAEEMQHTTKFSDGLTKEAEALLLTFTKVRGDAFERTLKASADLAESLGTDLKDAVKTVGLALQDPERGLRGLRSAGILFNESQQKTLEYLVSTGQQAKAQDIILTSLEQKYRGAAAAARDTLGGALAGLKNSFSSLFEGSGNNSGPTAAINELTKTLSDPALKAGIGYLVGALASVATLGVKAAAGVGNFIDSLAHISGAKFGSEIDQVREKIKALQKDIADASKPRQVGRAGYTAPDTESAPRRLRGGAAANVAAMKEDLAGLVDELKTLEETAAKSAPKTVAVIKDAFNGLKDPLQEVTVNVHKITTDIPDFLQQMNYDTRTQVKKTAANFIELKEQLRALVDEKIITPEEAAERRAEALEVLLPEFDLNEIRAKYKPIKQVVTELDEFNKGVVRGLGNSIRENFSSAIYDAKFDLKSLVDVARRAFADILAAVITSGIKKALIAQFTSFQAANTASGASGGLWGGFVTGVLSLFGASAAGGRSDKPRWVGEEGPELLTEPGQITNKRSLAAMGGMGGATITFAPSFSYVVTEREDPAKTKADMARYTETRLAQQQSEFVRTLRRSGISVRG